LELVFFSSSDFDRLIPPGGEELLDALRPSLPPSVPLLLDSHIETLLNRLVAVLGESIASSWVGEPPVNSVSSDTWAASAISDLKSFIDLILSVFLLYLDLSINEDSLS
jgi:hypothetical protein